MSVHKETVWLKRLESYYYGYNEMYACIALVQHKKVPAYEVPGQRMLYFDPILQQSKKNHRMSYRSALPDKR
jgi:hypothetical protein